MKTLRLAFFLSAAILAVVACSKAAPAQPDATLPVVVAPVQAPAPVPPATPAPTSTETSDKLKAYTFEQRAEFKGFVNELTAQSDAVVTKLNMGYNSMLVTPARRTAMENLTKAAADFKTQAHALDNVSADTWDSVKSALVNCWQNFAGALTKVRESKN